MSHKTPVNIIKLTENNEYFRKLNEKSRIPATKIFMSPDKRLPVKLFESAVNLESTKESYATPPPEVNFTKVLEARAPPE
jgi:hypothetical protein